MCVIDFENAITNIKKGTGQYIRENEQKKKEAHRRQREPGTDKHNTGYFMAR